MKNIISEAINEAKKIPKKAWLAAVIMPGGFVVITTYILTKTLDKKEIKNGKTNLDNAGC